MFFDENGIPARHGDAGFHRQRHGKSQEREQGAQLLGSVRCVASRAKPLVLRRPWPDAMFNDDGKFDAESLATLLRSFADLKLLDFRFHARSVETLH